MYLRRVENLIIRKFAINWYCLGSPPLQSPPARPESEAKRYLSDPPRALNAEGGLCVRLIIFGEVSVHDLPLSQSFCICIYFFIHLTRVIYLSSESSLLAPRKGLEKKKRKKKKGLVERDLLLAAGFLHFFFFWAQLDIISVLTGDFNFPAE